MLFSSVGSINSKPRELCCLFRERPGGFCSYSLLWICDIDLGSTGEEKITPTRRQSCYLEISNCSSCTSWMSLHELLVEVLCNMWRRVAILVWKISSPTMNGGDINPQLWMKGASCCLSDAQLAKALLLNVLDIIRGSVSWLVTCISLARLSLKVATSTRCVMCDVASYKKKLECLNL